MFRPSGVFAAMLTPLNQNGRLNEPTVRKMVDFFIEKGIDGIFPVSSVGEFVLLDEDEKRNFVDIVIDQARGRLKITPGISSPTTRQSITFGKFCMKAGADGVVCSAPYFYKYPPDLVESFLATVAKSLNLPVVLYNIPMLANEITLDNLHHLLKIDNIVAIKDSSGSLTNVLNILNLVDSLGKDFSVLVGYEELLLASLAHGGSGCMSASAGIMPELMTAIYRNFKAGNMVQAARCQRLIAEATEQMKKPFFPYGYKLGMASRGFDMGPFGIELPPDLAQQTAQQAITIQQTIMDVLQKAQA